MTTKKKAEMEKVEDADNGKDGKKYPIENGALMWVKAY